MGGTGSGRWGGRPTLEATGAICLTVSDVLQRGKHRYNPKRPKLDAPIVKHTGAVDCRRPHEGDWITFRFEAVTNVTERVGFVDFSYVVDGKLSEHRVHLMGQQQPFGGLRWFFECPVTCDRVHTLCLPRGEQYLASRAGYKLAYQCQRESDGDRAYRRAWKARRRVRGVIKGSHETLDTPVSKPRYRHWSTFDRDVAKLEHSKDVYDLHFYRGAVRLGIAMPAGSILRGMAKEAPAYRRPKAIKVMNAKRQIEREKQARADAVANWARDYYAKLFACNHETM